VPTRGDRPELTVAKHQLRDWIESRLATLGQQFDDKALAIQINRTLKTVEMPPLPDAPGEFNLMGTVRDVDLHFDSGAFVVVTGVGILCGYDESVYAYEWRNGRWERFWESEQNDYTPEKTYKPRSIDSVYVWAGSIDSGRLVREVVRNYSIRGDHIQRVDPVALSPRDFVDEWLVRPWTESAAWSGAAGLEEWHKKLHADWVAGDSTIRLPCIARHQICGRWALRPPTKRRISSQSPRCTSLSAGAHHTTSRWSERPISPGLTAINLIPKPTNGEPCSPIRNGGSNARPYSRRSHSA